MSLWDYTKLAETIDAITGATIRRRAQHVILFDAVTGAPAATGGGGGGGGTAVATTPTPSTLDLPTQAALTTTARALMPVGTMCLSFEIQSIRPDGTFNTGLIAIGTATRQTLYIAPGDAWNDPALYGKVTDLSQVFVRALTAGDCITLVVRS